MSAVILIAIKEVKQKNSKPLFYLNHISCTYDDFVNGLFLVKAADEGKKKCTCFNRGSGKYFELISYKDASNVNYSFVSDYLEIEEFKIGKRFQEYDVLLEK